MDKLSENDLAQIQSKLELNLPEDVRNKYLESNGYIGPCNVQLLHSYKLDVEDDILHMNKLKKEDWYPDELDQLVLLGSDGTGGVVGYDHKIKKAVIWYPVEGTHYQETANTVTEIWEKIIYLYENET